MSLRPCPPADLVNEVIGRFVPDENLGDWIRSTFIDPTGPLHNPDHAHLIHAEIGVLWTNINNARNMRAVIGQAELMPPMAMGKWQRARAEQQVEEWFGRMPDFLITLHACAAEIMDDATFCALVEHELYHCAQKMDPFGAPAFGSDGRPRFAIRGHDVEEFVGVVARYGATADVARLVRVANAGPTVAMANVSRSCGTCIRLAA